MKMAGDHFGRMVFGAAVATSLRQFWLQRCRQPLGTTLWPLATILWPLVFCGRKHSVTEVSKREAASALRTIPTMRSN